MIYSIDHKGAAVTLEQLRIFVSVAQKQHVTAGAAALNIAQSAASHAIAALESRYDVRLFDRIGRNIRLTEPGRALLGEAGLILGQIERAERMLREYGGLERGALAVQASQTIAGYWLPRHLVAFHRAHPGVEIRLAIGNTADVAEAVESGAAELGFIEGAIAGERLESQPVARDQLVIVVGPDHPWANAPAVWPGDLAGADWVMREPGSGTRSAFEQALTEFGVAPADLRVRMELPSNESVRAAVEAGLGAAALSASVAAPSLEAGLLCRIALKLPERAFYVISAAGRPRSRAAGALLEIVSLRAQMRG